MAEPLTPQDLEEIKANLTQLDIADDAIKTAKQAGLDVTGQEAESKAQRIQLLKIKQAYFPGQ